MKIRLVGSPLAEQVGHQFLMSYVVNDVVSIDAGCIGFMAPIRAQQRIKHVFLSHSHIDHVASLPIFLDNVHGSGTENVRVYGSRETLNCLCEHFFNDLIWPDLIRLGIAETPFMTLIPLEAGQVVRAEGLVIEAVLLDHVVPTFGYVISDGASSVSVVSDTGPTERIWQVLDATANLKAVFLEASFPESLAWLAEKSKHLTPLQFRDEVRKLRSDVRVIAVHIKPAYHDIVINELMALGLPQLEIGIPESEYLF